MRSDLLIIFAKEPVAGKVKTRLAKDIGQEAALKVYLSLLKRTFRTFKQTKYDVQLYFTPSNKHLKQMVPPKFKQKKQKGKNLGSRMLRAFKENLNKYEKVIIIGVDCPKVNKKIVKQAFDKLKKYPTVLGPAHDGGYYLIGLSIIYPSLFKRIGWGTKQVLKQTLARCGRLGAKPVLLKKLYDIDTIADLERGIPLKY